MDFENIVFEVVDGVATVTINRPEKLNALNIQTMNEIKHVFTLLHHTEVSAVILTGMGEKAFVAGADIKEINELDKYSGIEFALKGQEIFSIIENFDKPVIAAVNGFALGGGCELALACHIRFASDNAKFAQPEINLGLIPGYGGTQRLTRLINKGRAMEMILTGDMVSADEALRIGLVNRIYPQSELLAKTIEFAGKLAIKSRSAVRTAINAVNAVSELSLSDGMQHEAELFSECCTSEDFKEGTQAFLEKRKPVFKNS